MNTLVEQIKTRLATGAPLPAERILADELGVKRHQLRNALKVLRDDGEIDAGRSRAEGSTRRNGEMLAQGTNPIEVIELRLALEPTLARLAALRATPTDIARIQRSSITPVGADRGAIDLAFHKAIASASGNVLAADVYSLIRQVGSDARLRIDNSDVSSPDRTKQRDFEHQAIAAAIAKRDPDAAELAMRNHLIRVRELIFARLT